MKVARLPRSPRRVPEPAGCHTQRSGVISCLLFMPCLQTLLLCPRTVRLSGEEKNHQFSSKLSLTKWRQSHAGRAGGCLRVACSPGLFSPGSGIALSNCWEIFLQRFS